ncbi:MAG: homoserine kinase [Bacteroidales bacterium]|nr:homoserine kinase [Bacteroidales bacterium]
MDKSVRVFAPATVSNVGSGFDIMGFAIRGAGDIISMELAEPGTFEIINLSGALLPENPEDNIVTPSLRAMQAATGTMHGFRITFHKKINPGSGIGSSAASAVASLIAYNQLIGSPLSPTELIPFAMEGEKFVTGSAHADNAAPCMLGGFTLIRSYHPLDIISIPYPADLWCTVIHPALVIRTSESRRLVPKDITLENTIIQTGNAAALVTGLITGDMALIGRSLTDAVAEPYRKKLIPGYDHARQAAMDEGALGFNISGSGPSLFALSTGRDAAKRIGKSVKKIFTDSGTECDIYISEISAEGARVI